jgi:hypothetical protein
VRNECKSEILPKIRESAITVDDLSEPTAADSNSVVVATTEEIPNTPNPVSIVPIDLTVAKIRVTSKVKQENN